MNKTWEQLTGCLGIAALGAFIIWRVWKSPDKFFKNYKASIYQDWFGRKGATGLYLGIGFFLLLIGLIGALSWLFEPS